MTILTYISFAINTDMICIIHHRSKAHSIKRITQHMFLLYKKHFFSQEPANNNE